MTARPYPPDIRSKGWRFELDLEQIHQSDTWALAPPEARPWLLMLWATAWLQVPCGSMPADDEVLMAKLGMPPKLFAKHRKVLMRGWWQADDGRLYHETITSRVLAMLGRKDAERQRKADYRAKKDAERQAAASVGVPEMSHGTTFGQTKDSIGKDDTGTRTGTGTGLKEKDKHPPAAPRAPAREESSFAMRVDWRPSEAFPALLKQAGLVSPTPDALDATIAEFIAYWLTKPEELRDQAEWDRTFLKNLKRAKVEADSKPTASSATPARRTGSRHHGINETNFSEGVSDDGRF